MSRSVLLVGLWLRPRRVAGAGRRQVGSAWTCSLPPGYVQPTRLARCGDRMRLTYVVTKGAATARVSFAVARAARR